MSEFVKSVAIKAEEDKLIQFESFSDSDSSSSSSEQDDITKNRRITQKYVIADGKNDSMNSNIKLSEKGEIK